MSSQGNQGSQGGGDLRADGTVPLKGNLVPDVDSERSIGSEEKKIAEVHADRLLGDVVSIFSLDSEPATGGGASEALVVTGLLQTDTVLAVTAMTDSAEAVIGFEVTDDDELTVDFTGDPGADAVVRVLIKR